MWKQQQMKRYSRWIPRLASGAAAIVLVTLLSALAYHMTAPLVTVDHAPASYSARAGAFGAHVTGRVRMGTTALRYRIGDGEWRPLEPRPPRVTLPEFTLEMLADELVAGHNRVELEAHGWLGVKESRSFAFDYDPAPPALPLAVDWVDVAELDVQDGFFEHVPGHPDRVRPVPGHEGWDRIIAASGAFEGGRRVSLDLVFRKPMEGRRSWGFGLFPLWGGQPNPDDRRARAGWRFSLLWYFNLTGGFGCSFSEKQGDGSAQFIATYRNIELEADRTYRLLTETVPVLDGDGRHLAWRQRCKWWPADEPEPEVWTEAIDEMGAPLPPLAYGVALVAFRSQVEFGAVRIEPMDSEIRVD